MYPVTKKLDFLFYEANGRVRTCLAPTKDCTHVHHYFLSLAAREAFLKFDRTYHISYEGIVERCQTSNQQCKFDHYTKRSEVVRIHKETYDFSGPWRPTENPYVSLLEKEVADFLELLPFKVECNTRKVIGPSEIDIWLPRRDLAIEFNGDYWHSNEVLQSRTGKTSREYHLSKLFRCQAQGIKLGFIWEANWLQSPETMIDVLSDFLQFKRDHELLQQYGKAASPSRLHWESVDREGSMKRKLRVENRLFKAARV